MQQSDGSRLNWNTLASMRLSLEVALGSTTFLSCSTIITWRAVAGSRLESVILDQEDVSQIHEWYERTNLTPSCKREGSHARYRLNTDGVWELSYRGSRDGFRAFNFHQMCDDPSPDPCPTLTVIKTNAGHVMGGEYILSILICGRFIIGTHPDMIDQALPRRAGPRDRDSIRITRRSSLPFAIRQERLNVRASPFFSSSSIA